MSTKVCTKCGETKLATSEYFYRDSKNVWAEFRAICTECTRTYNRTHVTPTTDARKLYMKEYSKKYKLDNHDSIIIELYSQQNGLCYYCREELYGQYDVDHVIPLSRGGSNGVDNLVIACAFCNRSKGNKLLEEWNGFLPQLRS